MVVQELEEKISPVRKVIDIFSTAPIEMVDKLLTTWPALAEALGELRASWKEETNKPV